MPSPAVMRHLAGKEFGAKTVVIPCIRGLVGLHSRHEAGMLLMVLHVATGEWHGLVQALGTVPFLLQVDKGYDPFTMVDMVIHGYTRTLTRCVLLRDTTL